jgi:hypothetical protein
MPKSVQSRLEQLERRLPRKQPELPPIVAIFDDQCIALLNGDWVPWSLDRPVACWTKYYAFDPRGI